MTENKPDRGKINRKLILRFILILVYILILLFLWALLIEYGTNPLLLFILLLFIFLVTIGPLFLKRRKSMYSGLFPDKRQTRHLKRQKIKKRFVRRPQPEQTQPRIHKAINLDFKFSRPIISKCEKCGNIVPGFAKKCPFCGKILMY